MYPNLALQDKKQTTCIQFTEKSRNQISGFFLFFSFIFYNYDSLSSVKHQNKNMISAVKAPFVIIVDIYIDIFMTVVIIVLFIFFLPSHRHTIIHINIHNVTDLRA